MTNKEIVEFFEALKMLAKEKGIDPEYLLERIRAAIVVAVKKDFGGDENILVTMDPEAGNFSVVIRKDVVEEVTDPDRELTRPEHFAYYEGYPVTLKFYRPDEKGQKEIAGILLAWEDGISIQTEEDETVVFDKKQIAAVHAIDVWDDDEEA